MSPVKSPKAGLLHHWPSLPVTFFLCLERAGISSAPFRFSPVVVPQSLVVSVRRSGNLSQQREHKTLFSHTSRK